MGLYKTDDSNEVTGRLFSDEQKVLSDINSVICNAEVTRKKMYCAPTLVVGKALDAEHDENWEGHTER